jgi:hypothetical protein
MLCLLGLVVLVVAVLLSLHVIGTLTTAETEEQEQGVFCVKDWYLPGEVKLPRPVTTPLGGRVRCITCSVDIYYRIEAGVIEVVRVRLAGPASGGLAADVVATRRGEAWSANGRLRRYLETEILPHTVKQLVATDERLQRVMWGKFKAGSTSN